MAAIQSFPQTGIQGYTMFAYGTFSLLTIASLLSSILSLNSLGLVMIHRAVFNLNVVSGIGIYMTSVAQVSVHFKHKLSSPPLIPFASASLSTGSLALFFWLLLWYVYKSWCALHFLNIFSCRVNGLLYI